MYCFDGHGRGKVSLCREPDDRPVDGKKIVDLVLSGLGRFGRLDYCVIALRNSNERPLSLGSPRPPPRCCC
jgi:hypothetical protein